MEENFTSKHTQIIQIGINDYQDSSGLLIAKALAKKFDAQCLTISNSLNQDSYTDAINNATKFLFFNSNQAVTSTKELATFLPYADFLFLTNDKNFIKNTFLTIEISGVYEAQIEMATQIINDFEKAKKLGFNAADFIEIYNRKINLNTIEFQFNIIKSGIPKINLDRTATVNDGIISITKDEATYYSNYFDQKKESLKLKKFVPASGAASRMFKFLNEFLNDFNLGEESINAYINRKKEKNLPVFLVAKEKFPFYEAVIKTAKTALPDYDNWEKDSRDYGFIKTMLSANHFDYANKPKGVLPFHQYETHTATAIEEHLKECLYYATTNTNSHLHFTISEEHQKSFELIIENVKPKLEYISKATITVNYSYQNKSTDVIALDNDGNPFRDEKNQILFRPGGHGALIENLNNLNADIIFIKNIDNVIQNHLEVIALYKKALAGILIQYQEVVFNFMKLLNTSSVSNDDIIEIVNYIKSKLNISIKPDFAKYTKESKVEHLQTILNRPIRICGMVKNEGEPGGGPFWIIDKKGKTFLQIIESSQIDIKDENQIKIFESGTHFNPVDLVCGIKDYNEQKFDLKKFIDANSGFVVDKTKNGKPYKAFELPGLWNGAMAKWLTVFVEVPLITFNPVKTVNDLLKPAHQPQE